MTALVQVPLALNSAIFAFGDSLVVGTSGWNYTASGRWLVRFGALFRPPLITYNFGAGGETATDIKIRFLARKDRSIKRYILWAGRNGVLSDTPAAIVAEIQAMINDIEVGSDFMVLTIPPKTDGTEDPGDVQGDKVIALNAAILTAWPGRVLDINSTIGMNPADRTDGVHLTEACQARVAVAVHDKAVAMGWK